MLKKLLIFVLLIVVLSVGGLLWVKNAVEPVSGQEKSVDFLITKGSSVTLIANNLYKNGLIKSPLAFKFYVQLMGKQKRIAAGEFRLSPSNDLFETVDILQKGPIELWVTIPEGLRHEEIATKFTNGLEKDEAFTQEFVSLAEDLEGYLYPDTYLFPKEVTAQQVVNRMKDTFNKKVGTEITQNQVIMASLIERETKGNAEKPVVAGILYKRIANGWPLQVDATIQYAKGSWASIYSEDKQLNSLYNTYKYQGLPPGPISNPGLPSLKAAQNPEESEYWYYIHDNSGQIHYGVTLEDHNSNIAKYLR
jgi:UPF0755 protein